MVQFCEIMVPVRQLKHIDSLKIIKFLKRTFVVARPALIYTVKSVLKGNHRERQNMALIDKWPLSGYKFNVQ